MTDVLMMAFGSWLGRIASALSSAPQVALVVAGMVALTLGRHSRRR